MMPRPPSIRAMLLMFAMLPTSGCIVHHSGLLVRCGDDERSMQRSTLYFGAAIPNSNDVVDDREWAAFLAASVTPRFPDGLTWHDARGQWRGADGKIVGEPSRMLIVLHADEPSAAAAIDAIRSDYKTGFRRSPSKIRCRVAGARSGCARALSG